MLDLIEIEIHVAASKTMILRLISRKSIYKVLVTMCHSQARVSGSAMLGIPSPEIYNFGDFLVFRGKLAGILSSGVLTVEVSL